MEILNRISCPLCHNDKIVEEITCKDHLVSCKSFLLCRCLECGFLFTQNAPGAETIGEFYESEDYISHSDTKEGIMNCLYHHARQLNLKRKSSLVRKHTSKLSGRLLDVGTGTGYFPHAMQQLGWQVEAMEQSAVARSFAKKQFQLEVMPKDEWNQLFTESFDAVTLWHVMEHLHDLNYTWDEINRILLPNGRLIIAVPNVSSWDAKHYKSDWAAYDVPRHLWHFSPETMLLLAKKHGFKLEKIYPMPMDAFYISILSEKNKHHIMPFLRGMWTGVKAWFHCMANKKQSSSLIYVFKKQGA